MRIYAQKAVPGLLKGKNRRFKKQSFCICSQNWGGYTRRVSYTRGTWGITVSRVFPRLLDPVRLRASEEKSLCDEGSPRSRGSGRVWSPCGDQQFSKTSHFRFSKSFCSGTQANYGGKSSVMPLYSFKSIIVSRVHIISLANYVVKTWDTCTAADISKFWPSQTTKRKKCNCNVQPGFYIYL